MAQRSIHVSEELAKKIKLRRSELNLTIEEAASRAGVGTKTWSRYEAGGSIRHDKCRGICKALNWRDIPDDKSNAEKKSLIEEYRDNEAWSQFLADNFGAKAAMAFAVGSDILLDNIKQDLSDLASMPSGTHIGQLDTSFISDDLPPQFLMQYNYEFLYQMQCVLQKLRWRAKYGTSMIAHSILEELIIYLCNEEAKAFIEICEDDYDLTDDKELDNSMDLGGDDDLDDEEYPDDWENWVFEMFDDMDIITFLYSDMYLTEDDPFHFRHWGVEQFYVDRSMTESK